MKRISGSPTSTTEPSARQRLLAPASVGFAVLWLGVILLGGSVRSTGLVTIGLIGLGTTVVLGIAISRQHGRLSGMAVTDSLTGLVNHRGFHELLEARIADARRTRQPLVLVLVDLDNFKSINDTHGHPYGDEVLQSVGAKLRASIRSTDVAARTGGEEFALILPATDGEAGRTIAERSRAAIASVRARGFELSSSAGIAVFPDDARDRATLCQLADAALYWAKGTGKRRTRRFDPGQITVAPAQHQIEEIKDLIERPGGIEPVFQPVVALATGRVVGYEALARFDAEPSRSPTTWFAQAHGCGLGAELEAAAIRAALAAPDRPAGTHLALNVSPSALRSEAFASALPADLDEIVIEITEHESAAGEDGIAEALDELRRRGAAIAIDDAGAGYAGLNQVMQIRPDIVKLDRELIDGIRDDPPRMALVESFVRFARQVGAAVCAEGIESLDDLAVLADLDVEWGQGYALCRPAAPWARVSPVAAEVCRAALGEALRSAPRPEVHVPTAEGGLVGVTARLAGARSAEGLRDALSLIATELHADNVALSRWHPDRGVVETVAENGPTPDGETCFPIADYPLTAYVLREQHAAQVLVGDPGGDPAEAALLLELGHRSLLMVPVVRGGESLGIIEAFSDIERPWTRAEIERARIISNQFASVIEAVFRPDRAGVAG